MNNQFVPFVPHDFGSHQELATKTDPKSVWVAHETRVVNQLGKQMGFGRVMQLTQQEWRRTLIDDNDLAGSEFAYGPCVVFTYVCGCRLNNGPSTCDWCEGAGWLTKKVRELQIATGQ